MTEQEEGAVVYLLYRLLERQRTQNRCALCGTVRDLYRYAPTPVRIQIDGGFHMVGSAFVPPGQSFAICPTCTNPARWLTGPRIEPDLPPEVSLWRWRARFS